LTCGLCSSVASGISQKSARIGYCFLFGASLIVSWILREVGAPLLEKIPCNFIFLAKDSIFLVILHLGIFVLIIG
jgi:hypothetical protein